MFVTWAGSWLAARIVIGSGLFRRAATKALPSHGKVGNLLTQKARTVSAPLMRITGPFSGCEGFVSENAPLARFTWFKIGGNARWLVRPRNVEELQEAS